MTDVEKAFKIISKKNVNVALLRNCFDYPDDPFALMADPKMPKGLFVYNTTDEPGECWRVPLSYEEYTLLKKTLSQYR